MAKGIELGIVNQLPCIMGNNFPNGEKFKEKELYDSLITKNTKFANKVEHQSSKNPLCTINYEIQNPEIYKKYIFNKYIIVLDKYYKIII